MTANPNPDVTLKALFGSTTAVLEDVIARPGPASFSIGDITHTVPKTGTSYTPTELFQLIVKIYQAKLKGADTLRGSKIRHANTTVVIERYNPIQKLLYEEGSAVPIHATDKLLDQLVGATTRK